MTVAPAQFVVTGPTGWIGSALLHLMAETFGERWSEQLTLFGSSSRIIMGPHGCMLPVRPLQEMTPGDLDGAYLVHLAYLTKDRVEELGEAAFFAANTAIDDAVLAACRPGRPRGVFVASSGAARQAETGRGRECYGLCKLMQEDRFLEFGVTAGTPVLAGRIFNLAGPHINKLGSYAVASLLAQAFRTGETRVEARTPVYRAYLHVVDLCALVLGALERGVGPGAPIDLAGPLTVEMEDVAREALRAAGRPQGRILRPPIDWDRPSLYLGDPTDARTLALRLALTLRSFAQQVDDTAADLLKRGVFSSDIGSAPPTGILPLAPSMDPAIS